MVPGGDPECGLPTQCWSQVDPVVFQSLFDPVVF